MTKKRKIKFESTKSKAEILFQKIVHYLGIIFLILTMIYACYVLLPEVFRFSIDFVISMIKKDYPNVN
jgi:hypothetical protein